MICCAVRPIRLDYIQYRRCMWNACTDMFSAIDGTVQLEGTCNSTMLYSVRQLIRLSNAQCHKEIDIKKNLQNLTRPKSSVEISQVTSFAGSTSLMWWSWTIDVPNVIFVFLVWITSPFDPSFCSRINRPPSNGNIFCSILFELDLLPLVCFFLALQKLMRIVILNTLCHLHVQATVRYECFSVTDSASNSDFQIEQFFSFLVQTAASLAATYGAL